MMDTHAWRWGARTYADMLGNAPDLTLDAAAVSCPLLRIDRHAIGTNLSLMAQLVFDWLDEVLSARPALHAGVPA